APPHARSDVVPGRGDRRLRTGAVHAVDLAAPAALVRIRVPGGVHPGGGRGRPPRAAHRDRADRRAQHRAGQPGRAGRDQADGIAALSARAVVVPVVALASSTIVRAREKTSVWYGAAVLVLVVGTLLRLATRPI